MKSIDEVYNGMTEEKKKEIIRGYYRGLDHHVREVLLEIHRHHCDFTNPREYFKSLFSRGELEEAGLLNPEYERFLEDAVNMKLNEGELHSSRLK